MDRMTLLIAQARETDTVTLVRQLDEMVRVGVDPGCPDLIAVRDELNARDRLGFEKTILEVHR